ncbi:methyltransferase domain-containing protein [Allopusillimonas ginsengisoli]|nr:methyltransferase domain-containing protein [Allopusillimonas ginsengisoli]
MSLPPSLPIDPRHVNLQFGRRQPLDAAQFLYGEIAQRMLQRLSYVRLQPADVLDAGCGAGHAIEPLRARYPGMDYTGLDACAPLLDVARERYETSPSFWQKLRNKPTPPVHFMQADLADTGLPAQHIDLVWSNMALHWHAEPHRVLAEWRRILRPGGLAMYSSLGPGSLIELRQAITDARIDTTAMEFVDMHDFGDLMLVNGFADPVMDQEIITLTYRTPEKLLEDIKALGGNASAHRRKGLAGRRWRQRLLDALNARRNLDGTIHLTLEVAYGHAWRTDAKFTPFGGADGSAGSKGRKGPDGPTVRPRDADDS